MGLLSSSAAIVRYRVSGKIESDIKETILNGLKKYAVSDDFPDETSNKCVGWTTFNQPYHPDFEDMRFEVGPYFLFSMRIDKKNISAKLIQKHVAHESARRIKNTGRKYLTKDEKKSAREHAMTVLLQRVPATPSVYDLLWNHQEAFLYFFSTLKSANEDLETLFFKTFKLSLIRLFPYTLAELTMNLSDRQKDALMNITPTTFMD